MKAEGGGAMASTVAPPEIREAVRRMFNRVAEAPSERYRFAVGPVLAREVGYPEGALESLPPWAFDSFTGLAYLHPRLGLRPGDRVLDLGSGGGMDAVLAGQAVLPGGSVAGLDIADEMVGKARHVAAAVRADHVRFEQGPAEAMPFADATFDVAFANGLLNLCPDKTAVAREVWRVLKPGGRAVIAEITFVDPLPAKELETVDDWFR
jgi:arsenite methyltransferase